MINYADTVPSLFTTLHPALLPERQIAACGKAGLGSLSTATAKASDQHRRQPHMQAAYMDSVTSPTELDA